MEIDAELPPRHAPNLRDTGLPRREFLKRLGAAAASATGATPMRGALAIEPMTATATATILLVIGGILTLASIGMDIYATVLRRRAGRAEAEASENRRAAELALEKATLENLELLGRQNTEIAAMIERLDQGLDERIERTMRKVQTEHQDLNDVSTIYGLYTRFLELRQGMLEHPESWTDNDVLDRHHRRVNAIADSFKTFRATLQHRWPGPRESGIRIACMALVMSVELELDAEMEGMGEVVRSGPAMKAYLDWFDAQGLEADIAEREQKVGEADARFESTWQATPEPVWRKTRSRNESEEERKRLIGELSRIMEERTANATEDERHQRTKPENTVLLSELMEPPLYAWLLERRLKQIAPQRFRGTRHIRRWLRINGHDSVVTTGEVLGDCVDEVKGDGTVIGWRLRVRDVFKAEYLRGSAEERRELVRTYGRKHRPGCREAHLDEIAPGERAGERRRRARPGPRARAMTARNIEAVELAERRIALDAARLARTLASETLALERAWPGGDSG